MAELERLPERRPGIGAEAREGPGDLLEVYGRNEQGQDPSRGHGEGRGGVEHEPACRGGHVHGHAHPHHHEGEVRRGVLGYLDGRPHQPDEGQPEGHSPERQCQFGEPGRLGLGDGGVQLALDQVSLAGDDGLEQAGGDEIHSHQGYGHDRHHHWDGQRPRVVAGDGEHTAYDHRTEEQIEGNVEPLVPVAHLPVQRGHYGEGAGQHHAHRHELAHGVDVAEAVDEHLHQQVHQDDDQEIGETGPDHGDGGHAHPAQKGIYERALVHAEIAPQAFSHRAAALPVLHPSRAAHAHEGAEKEVEREHHEEQDHGVMVCVGEKATLDVPRHDGQEQGCQQAGAVPEGRAGDHEDRDAGQGAPYGRRGQQGVSGGGVDVHARNAGQQLSRHRDRPVIQWRPGVPHAERIVQQGIVDDMGACFLNVVDDALVIVRVRASADQEAVVHRSGVSEVATHEQCYENDSH